MIALDTPTMVLQAAAATGELVAHVVARTVPQGTKESFEEYQRRLTRTVFTGGTQTICAAPEVNTFKAIEYIGVVTSTTTGAVTISTYDGTNRYSLIVHTLNSGEGLYYEEHHGWYVV